MTDYVVDTNVWVMVDLDISKATLIELNCMEACRRWLKDFQNNQDKLVVDDRYAILGEYRKNIRSGGRAYILFSQLETMPKERLIEQSIVFDDNGYAVVTSHIRINDPNDRKFIAVALAHTPTPPIINATDTDWSKESNKLIEGGLEVREICPNYIEEKLK